MDNENKPGLNYPIWVGDAPKPVDITAEDFYKLSWMGLASLWCSYKVLFHKTTDGSMKMYTSKYNICDTCYNSKRFEGIDWFHNEAAEMYLCTIPAGHKLITTIEKKFKHLIMEGITDGK
jgi:hypothetical protein